MKPRQDLEGFPYGAASPGTLSPEDIRRFSELGYLPLKGAFDPGKALAIQDRIWNQFAERCGTSRSDNLLLRRPA